MSAGPFSDTASIKVTVKDVNEPPVFSVPLNEMVVSEDARVGTSIGRVSAHDPDTSNNVIKYVTPLHVKSPSLFIVVTDTWIYAG